MMYLLGSLCTFSSMYGGEGVPVGDLQMEKKKQQSGDESVLVSSFEKLSVEVEQKRAAGGLNPMLVYIHDRGWVYDGQQRMDSSWYPCLAPKNVVNKLSTENASCTKFGRAFVRVHMKLGEWITLGKEPYLRLGEFFPTEKTPALVKCAHVLEVGVIGRMNQDTPAYADYIFKNSLQKALEKASVSDLLYTIVCMNALVRDEDFSLHSEARQDWNDFFNQELTRYKRNHKHEDDSLLVEE